MSDKRKIGGYIEFEHYSGTIYHECAVALNSGRNALAYLCETKNIKQLRLPLFLCSSVMNLCSSIGVRFTNYPIKENFEPDIIKPLADDEWFYIVNYYGQLNDEKITEYSAKYKRIIVDNSQSYFQRPDEEYPTDTLYSCRKYFGVSDGAFLYTDRKLDRCIPVDESYKRMEFLLGRFDTEDPGLFYDGYKANNMIFQNEPIKEMSRLTANILMSIDYDKIRKIRNKNFKYLDSKLRSINELKLDSTNATFMYPLLIRNGSEVRKELIKSNLFVPQLWPLDKEHALIDSLEYRYSEDILPLPIDQRYSIEDMEYIVSLVNNVVLG